MIARKRVLIVEGADDLHVTKSLLARHGVPELFTVEEKGGVERVLELLPVQLKGSGVERVGITIDADVHLLDRWHSVHQILTNAGYQELPEYPAADGTIIVHADLPRFGIWLMPNNVLPGMIEDFAQFLIPQGDAVHGHVLSTIDSLPQEVRRFAAGHTSKAAIHTWLAWQQDPGTPMGLAITKKYLDAECDQAISYVRWLERLFVS